MLSFAIAAALAAQAAPAPPPTPKPTRQQAFDAAAAAADREDWEAAFRQFDALETQLAGAKSARNLALIRLRKGEALIKLGRAEEAEASVRAGLAGIPTTDANLKEDRVYARLILGEIAEARFDHPAALREFAAARDEGAGTALADRALFGKIRAGTFVDSRAAAADADIAIAAITGTDKATKERRAGMRTLKGRALLNAGDFAGASAELERATTELGGLTLRVSYSDLVARSDLAIAALLAGRPEKAREYLAYTGAGRFVKGVLPAPIVGKLPKCGATTGLRPDDVAVIELALRDDGTVAFARPIYAARSATAAPFAASASRWSWSADAMAKLPALVRAVTRLELRCRQAPEQLGLFDYLEQHHNRWAATPQSADDLKALSLGTLRMRLEQTGAAALPLRLMLMKAIVDHPASTMPETGTVKTMARDAARAGKAPPMIRAYWELRRAWNDAPARPLSFEDEQKRYGAAVAAIERDEAIAADPRVRAAVAIVRAETLPSGDVGDRERTKIYAQVANDPALPVADDLKIAAKVRLAGVLSGTNKHDEARRVYESTGLAAGQCPVLDIGRRTARLNSDSSDFPMEAQRWGFEGWALSELVISADGRPSAARTLMAYPPFVFSKAGELVGRGGRFEPSYRPQSEATCGGQSQRVAFRIAE